MSVYNTCCSIFLKFRRESGINPILSGQHLKSDVFFVACAAVACSGVQSVKLKKFHMLVCCLVFVIRWFILFATFDPVITC